MKKYDMQIFINNLKEIEKDSGLKRGEFESKIGRKAYFWQLENGRVEKPATEVLLNIYTEFGVDITWLLTGQGSPYPESQNNNPSRVEILENKLKKHERVLNTLLTKSGFEDIEYYDDTKTGTDDVPLDVTDKILSVKEEGNK